MSPCIVGMGPTWQGPWSRGGAARLIKGCFVCFRSLQRADKRALRRGFQGSRRNPHSLGLVPGVPRPSSACSDRVGGCPKHLHTYSSNQVRCGIGNPQSWVPTHHIPLVGSCQFLIYEVPSGQTLRPRETEVEGFLCLGNREIPPLRHSATGRRPARRLKSDFFSGASGGGAGSVCPLKRPTVRFTNFGARVVNKLFRDPFAVQLYCLYKPMSTTRMIQPGSHCVRCPVFNVVL